MGGRAGAPCGAISCAKKLQVQETVASVPERIWEAELEQPGEAMWGNFLGQKAASPGNIHPTAAAQAELQGAGGRRWDAMCNGFKALFHFLSALFKCTDGMQRTDFQRLRTDLKHCFSAFGSRIADINKE